MMSIIVKPLLSLLLLFSSVAPVFGAGRPNLLFILADDVGIEALGCYGGESYRTPTLDHLAEQGLRFDYACAMPVCHPTRVCLLTGQYPFRLGNPDWGTFPKEAEQRTVAQLIKAAGYATAIAGKWQLTMLGQEPDHPHRLGFDEYCLFGWHEGPRYYEPYIRQNGKLRADVRERYGPDVYCDFLIDFMRKHSDQPFFAFYSMALCHAVTNDLDQPVPLGPEGRYQTFAEMVQSMDEHVGRMLQALDESGLRDNTLVIFVADNGSPAKNYVGVRDGQLVTEEVVSRYRGRSIPGGKSQLNEAGTRVPLLVRWPGQIETGQVAEDLVDMSDFLPTLVEIAGAELPAGISLDGKSFADRLTGADHQGREWVFAQHKGRAFVKNQRWKCYDDGTLYRLPPHLEEELPVARSQLSAADAAEVKKLDQVMNGLIAKGLLAEQDSKVQ